MYSTNASDTINTTDEMVGFWERENSILFPFFSCSVIQRTCNLIYFCNLNAILTF